jgi:hypothetical protein
VQQEWSILFPESVPVTAGVPIAWEDVPAKGALYLLATQDGDEEKPLLLATVGDLRAALKRRFEELPGEVKSKRIDFAKVCTRILWRRVDSSFAANWWYWRAARVLFPATYAALVPWRTSWWIAVERAGSAVFPRMRRTSDLRDGGFDYAGPVRDKHATERMIETVIDLFDLCRYHPVLLQAPAGKACAYKEMGKCPAPCDGSVPAEWYAGQMRKAWGFITGETRAAWKAEIEAQMRAAAGRLEFETAGRLKKVLTRAGGLEGRGGGAGEATALVKNLDAFSFVSLQPAKGKPWLEPWLVHGGAVEVLPQVAKKTLEADLAGVHARYMEFANRSVRETIAQGEGGGVAAMEQIGLVAHHLFRGEDDHGVWVGSAALVTGGPAALVEAAGRLWARKAAPKPLVEVSTEKVEAEKDVKEVALPVVEGPRAG